MTKQEEMPYSEKSYELQWIEAEVDLAILEWENYEWLHRPLDDISSELAGVSLQVEPF